MERTRSTGFWIAFSLLVPLLAEGADHRFPERVREERERIESELYAPETRPAEAARLLSILGHHAEAESLVAALVPESTGERLDSLLRRTEIALARYEFAAAERSLDRAEEIAPGDDGSFRLRLALLVFREDMARVDTITARRLAANPTSPAALLGRAEFDIEQLRFDEAARGFEEALARAVRPGEGVRALDGLMRVAYRRNDFDSAADLASRALDAGPPTPGLLNGIVSILIRLGDVSGAVDLAREAVRWDPWNEQAHYILGNGYSRRNYTELTAAYPAAFAEGGAAAELDEIRGHLETGRREEAKRRLAALRTAEPPLAGPDLLLGALFWEEGESDSAIARFASALEKCPEYGRAHNGFAKAMEQKRLRVNVHAPRHERDFAETPWPEVPGLEAFVGNYDALSERHRKRIALSVAPWAPFVPVLLEAGATFYIKPLYERLSETPHNHLLKDARISYDSRLWDDVRGCGGYHTVTGVEDVERTVFRKYNTVLHELSHQVHYILTPEEKREIQETYRAAKEREESGRETFLSRYQGSSVYEYFAEGVNAYDSPRRDDYDSREVVRERLEALDPDLVGLVEGVLHVEDGSRYFVPAFVVSAYDRIENGRPVEAIGLLEKALARSEEDESALCALAYTRNLLGSPAEAEEAAVRATKAHSRSADPWIENGRAVYHRTGNRSDEIATLLRGREEVERTQRYRIELALGEAYLGRGDLGRAGESFRWVLEYQEDHPDALWGLAQAHGLAAEAEEADRYFGQAIRRRNGIVELRADYARYLTRQERFEEAEEQIGEARLIDPKSSDAETAAGLLAIYRKEWAEAGRRLMNALAFAPYNDLATVLLAHTWVASGDVARAGELLDPLLASVERGDPPEFIYVDRKGRYEEIHRYPAEERWLLYMTASELAAARGDSTAARAYDRLMGQTFR